MRRFSQHRAVFVRYKDYRDPPWAADAYTFSKQYWSILAAKLAFVIFFQVRIRVFIFPSVILKYSGHRVYSIPLAQI